MSIIGEYSINYEIYTMFDVYSVNIKNHNLITNKGYEFFIKKWFTEDDKYPVTLGYYHDNKFYREKKIDDTFVDELGSDGNYSKTTNYVDMSTNKQYRFDGKNFVSFTEKLSKICLGDCFYNENTKALETDTDLYSPLTDENENIIEYEVTDFEQKHDRLIMKCSLTSNDINGTTEIGVKTNHNRLVSHDIHLPYNLPFTSDITLKYEFKLKVE